MLSSEEAMRQAKMTAHDYALYSLDALLKFLGIDRSAKDWRAQLAPFAPVWASMISASAKDFDTAMRSGVVDGYPVRAPSGDSE